MTAPRRNGFTLIEMLVALTMAAAVVTPLFIITRGVSETSRSKQMAVEAMQRARLAMDLLARDFSRAGLFTSPNTAIDGRYLNRETAGSSVQFRGAVDHLNRGSDAAGSDAVVLTGNFLGSSAYTAYVTSPYQLVTTNPAAMLGPDDCLRQFDPSYAVANVIDANGRNLEAEVTAVAFAAGICTITVASADFNPGSFKVGDTVSVSANQTALFMVEGEELVRYFVAYDSPNSAGGGACSLDSEVATYADVNLNGQVVPATRQVLSGYVVDFQVWFRPISVNSVTGWTVPHYHTTAQIMSEDEGNFADGLKPTPEMHLLPLAADGTVGDADVSCRALNSSAIGPERVRSAMIQVTVRTERSDGTLRWQESDSDGPGRLVRQSQAPDESVAVSEGQPPFVYQLMTLTSEVAMPNMAARPDLLEGV